MHLKLNNTKLYISAGCKVVYLVRLCVSPMLNTSLITYINALHNDLSNWSAVPYLVHYVVICHQRSLKRLAPSRLFCFVILGVFFAWSTPRD